MPKKAGKKKPLTAVEQQQRLLRAHEKQLAVLATIAQRELIRAGVLSGPLQPGWTLDDAYPRPPVNQPPGTVPLKLFLPGTKIDPNAPRDPRALTTACSDPLPADAAEAGQLFLSGRPAAVLGSALMALDALAKAHGLLHRGASLLRRYAEIADELDLFLVDHGEELANRLRTSALSDVVATYGTDCVPLNFTEQVGLLNAVGIGAAARADAARRFAHSIEERVLSEHAVYEHQRHGPRMHFLVLLDGYGLNDEQIADVLDELPDRADFEHEMDWEDARAKAIRAVAVRIRRAKKTLGTRDPETRVPLEQRVLVLFCRYVSPGQPISIHIRSGGGVQDAGRERAALDSDGTPPKRPARS